MACSIDMSLFDLSHMSRAYTPIQMILSGKHSSGWSFSKNRRTCGGYKEADSHSVHELSCSKITDCLEPRGWLERISKRSCLAEFWMEVELKGNVELYVLFFTLYIYLWYCGAFTCWKYTEYLCERYTFGCDRGGWVGWIGTLQLGG